MKKVFDFIHHLFIPKEENNYRAKALHPDFLTYYLLIALFLTFAFKQTNLQNVLGFATDISVNKLYELTNTQREKDGLSDLNYNEKLAQAAAQKAQDMFNQNYWAHYGPNGATPWDFILRSGYQYEFAGENLAKNFLFSQGVMDAWMSSPTHRENILRKDYSEVGFAVVNGTLNGEQTTLVVQMFGKPLSGLAQKSPIIPAQPVQAAEQSQKSQVIEISPTPLPKTEPAILAKGSRLLPFSLSSIPLNMNVTFLGFLMLALVLDFYFASKLNVVRIGGKNIAHFIFLGFIVVGLFLITKGAII